MTAILNTLSNLSKVSQIITAGSTLVGLGTTVYAARGSRLFSEQTIAALLKTSRLFLLFSAASAIAWAGFQLASTIYNSNLQERVSEYLTYERSMDTDPAENYAEWTKEVLTIGLLCLSTIPLLYLTHHTYFGH